MTGMSGPEETVEETQGTFGAPLAKPFPKARSGGPQPNGDPLIRAKEFSVFYGTKAAVDRVTLDIQAGKVTAIIGPSGCGKSTYLRAINRMNDLIPGCGTAGVLSLEDQDLYAPDVDVVALRKMIGMVFQKPNPFPKSIFDNVAFGPRIHGLNERGTLDEIVERSLKRAALFDEVKDRLDHNALGLAGGQQQRLCIARAIAVDPKILLMDEPASALDPRSTTRIEDLIGELRGDYTIVIVTHNMQQAARISDEAGIMLLGGLVEFGDTTSIFTAPNDSRTEDYVTGRYG